MEALLSTWLPPAVIVGVIFWTNSMTKSNLNQRIDDLRSNMQRGHDALSTEVQSLRTELKADIHSVRTELKAELQAGINEAKADIRTTNKLLVEHMTSRNLHN